MVFKNHASICKLEAFDYSSSILYKKNNIFLKQIEGFQNQASICKLGAFDYTSSILKKENSYFSKKLKVFKIMLPFVN